MVGYIVLAIVKIIDNIISTAKNICVYKEKKIMSSVLTIISSLIFYLIIGEVIEDNTLAAIVIVSISSGIGNFIAMAVDSKCRRAAKWTYVITSSDVDNLKSFCNYIKTQNIKYVVCNGYNRNWDNTINIILFSRTKDESRIIKTRLREMNKNGFKYLLEVI